MLGKNLLTTHARVFPNPTQPKSWNLEIQVGSSMEIVDYVGTGIMYACEGNSNPYTRLEEKGTEEMHKCK